MNEAMWLPSLLVLGIGLVLGMLAAARLRRPGKEPEAAVRARLELEISDLEARRDDLYRRLRGTPEEPVSDAERAALEETAARTLQDLDRLRQQAQASGAERRSEPAAPGPPPRSRGEGAGRRNPLLVGAAFGAGMVLIVVLLVYWAIRDAQPQPEMTAAAPTPLATDPGADPHREDGPLSAEVLRRLAMLEERLDSDPEDTQARRELALALVGTGRFFEAFNHASELLQRVPEDPDGLLVHGIVRLTMGQASAALDLLDHVLAQHPSHSQALLYRGLALYQMGNPEQAIDSWEMGLELVGGSDLELEQLLAMARAGGEPSPTAIPAQRSAVTPGSGSDSTPSVAVGPEGFSARIELAAGVAVTPQATLFVYLRPDEGGPPVAARRIAAPRFPVQLTLGASDSMMGSELPPAGILVARLDHDGDVSTVEGQDLQSETAADQGRLVRLVLAR